jgi:hypothetical protein
MDVLRGSRGDPYQEFRKGEGLENLQTSSARGGGGGEFGSAAAVPDVVAAVRGGRPFVPSISGGFTLQKSSDIQEVGAGFFFLFLLPSVHQLHIHTSLCLSAHR